MMENLITLLTLLGKSFQMFGFQQLAVFGDSISDIGPDMMGTAHGFKKFCSGPNWVDFMGKTLDVKIENYAYSGGKSDLGNYYGYQWSGGLWQVDQYLKEHNNKVPPNTLVVSQAMGINDFAADETNFTKVAENFFEAQCRLAEHGAEHILIFNILDLGPVPWVCERQEYRARLSEFVKSANILLAMKIQELVETYPNVNFYPVDVELVLTDMEKLGGLTMEVFDHHLKETRPKTAAEFAFFDDWHPSSVVHSHMTLEAYRALMWKIHGVRLSAPGGQAANLHRMIAEEPKGDLYSTIRNSIRRNMETLLREE